MLELESQEAWTLNSAWDRASANLGGFELTSLVNSQAELLLRALESSDQPPGEYSFPTLPFSLADLGDLLFTKGAGQRVGEEGEHCHMSNSP